MSAKLAYIFLVYKYPEQFCRLLRVLNTGPADFFIHVDKKVNIKIFRNYVQNLNFKNITFIKRETGRWGGIGVIKAAIHGLVAVANNKKSYDQILLITGQDYPIKKIKYIHKFFEKNSNKSFFDYFELPSNAWKHQGLDRIEKSHFYFHGRLYSHPPYSQPGYLKDKAIQYFMKCIFPEKRVFPKNIKPYGGSDWWSVSLGAAHYILTFLKERPDYIRFHKYSSIPSEGFFQTILLNAKNKEISGNVVNDNLRYIDWSHGGKNPAIITSSYFEKLKQSNKLFARKFDFNVDLDIITMIDNNILNSETSLHSYT
jgi:hypothetical protein